MCLRKGIAILLCLVVIAGMSEAWGFAPPDTLRINAILSGSLRLQRIDEDSSYRLASQAFRLSQKINFQKGIRGALIRIGSIVYMHSYNDSALAIIQAALEISKSMNDPAG